VLLSLVIAVISSFAAFGLAERSASASQKNHKIAWNFFGACSLGLGIWAMHFVGMLALELPIPVSFDIERTIISIVPAIFASSIILWAMTLKSYSHKHLLLSGLFLGASIGLMHHIGMTAMRMNAVMVHHQALSVLSVLFAISAATLALKIQSQTAYLNQHQIINKGKVVRAFFMGLAISGMHYTAMAAVTFFPEIKANSTQGISSNGLAILVSAAILTTIIASILIPHLLRYRQTTKELTRLIEEEQKSAARIRSIMNSSQDALIQVNRLGEVSGWSKQAEVVFGWPETDIIGKSIAKIIHNPASGSINLVEAFTQETPFLFERAIEMIAQHRQGQETPIELTVGVIGAGNQQEFSAFVRDISVRKRDEEVLRVLAETGSSKTESIYKIIARQLAQSMNVRYAMISLINVHNPTQADTLAIWANNSFIDNFSYPLAGSPCEIVTQEQFCFYPDNIQTHFPEDHLLVDMQAESYLGFALKDSQDKVIGIINLLDDKPIGDITQISVLISTLATRAGIELEKRESDKKLELSARVFNNAQEGIAITDSAGLIIDINPAFSEITGYSREEALGQNPRTLKSGQQNPPPYAGLRQALKAQGYWKGEVWNRKKSGELYAELLTISILKDNEGNTLNYLGIFSDITHSKEQQKELEMMAHYDVLTKLPNRALFYDRFLQAVAHSKRTKTVLAICFLDLDNFKPVNDTHGHEVGDRLLIEVASRIKANIREEDTLSRQGGDEFTLLLGDLDSFYPCEKMLSRMLNALSKPYFIGEHTINISASLGVTLYPSDDGDIDTLVRHADQAMYQAKLAGKNSYRLFDTEHDQMISENHQQRAAIQHALLNGELCLYYQPKVNMKTGEVYGAEALIRWQHPEKGLIPPMDFLPAIEETLLEVQIGEWVIQQALEQLNDWNRQGIKLEISVNIASYHLQSGSFVSQLEKALSKQPAVNPNHLQLEVLESSALGDTGIINRIIRACQEVLGVKVALDDFGTGYSSLTHLRNLPAETIKIDRSFVQDILDDPDDFIIVDGIIGLADSFDREVIAEGVESTEHGAMLILMGCNYAQGYGIARPMPADEMATWLKSYLPNREWLAFSCDKHSQKEKRIQLLKLALKQWAKQLETAIQSPPDQTQSWPIMEYAKCSCGVWLKREEQGGLFDPTWLAKLEKLHKQLHSEANSLKILYQEKELCAVRSRLPLLKKELKKIELLLAAAS
jgi:diguanylate cyclase (GGDEF)-like protein/PAS domain S-box-containing protein